MYELIPAETIEAKVLLLRGQKVMLDSDLAELYGVPTKALNQAVRRNAPRFPSDFMFQLSPEEWLALNQSQFVTGLQKHRNPRLRPFAFTEQGVAMLSSVLRSERAVQGNVEIMRTFVRLRQWLASNAELARRLNELESKYEAQFGVVFEAIRELMKPDEPSRGRIGFHHDQTP